MTDVADELGSERREDLVEELPASSRTQVKHLAGKIHLHASSLHAHQLIDQIDRSVGGVVVAGNQRVSANEAIRNLRDSGYDGIAVADPANYVREVATPDRPFIIDAGDGLFEPALLSEVVDAQVRWGATVGLTPTGFIPAGEPDTLRAVVREAEILCDRPGIMLTVPLDVAWFNRTYAEQATALLLESSLPLALILGGQFNPVEQATKIIPNLRSFFRLLPGASLFRTDLIGFDALAHKAFAVSVGSGGSLRHTVDPRDKRRSFDPRDPSPSVLFADLAEWKRGSTIQKVFGGQRAPLCSCAACGGRRLNTFSDRDDSVAARRHGVAVWSEWARLMLAESSGVTHERWWAQFCEGRIAEHAAWNLRLRQPGAFKLQPWLRICAKQHEEDRQHSP